MEQQEIPEQESEAPETAPKESPMEQQEAAPSIEGLIEMLKDGDAIHVHPTAVKDHQSAGWTLA